MPADPSCCASCRSSKGSSSATATVNSRAGSGSSLLRHRPWAGRLAGWLAPVLGLCCAGVRWTKRSRLLAPDAIGIAARTPAPWVKSCRAPQRLRCCRAAPGSRLRAHPLRGRLAAALRIPGAGPAAPDIRDQTCLRQVGALAARRFRCASARRLGAAVFLSASPSRRPCTRAAGRPAAPARGCS